MGGATAVIRKKSSGRQLGKHVTHLESSTKQAPTSGAIATGSGHVADEKPKNATLVTLQKPACRLRTLGQHVVHLDSSSKLAVTPGGETAGVTNDKKSVSETKPADIRRRLAAKDTS